MFAIKYIILIYKVKIVQIMIQEVIGAIQRILRNDSITAM